MDQNMVSWGRLPGCEQRIEPAAGVEVLAGLMQRNDATLPVGLGRSYGDSGIAAGGTGIGLTGLDEIGVPDPHSGRITCEAGASLAQILDALHGTGWTLPVVPGTKQVTVGGAIANDVHGKNHHSAGTFGGHVISLELLRSGGERLHCSAAGNNDWFELTIGGLGLTGIITRVELQLCRSQGNWFNVSYSSFDNLAEFFDLSVELTPGHEFTVAWFDCAASGDKLGRGIFMAGDAAGRQEEGTPKRRWFGLPFTPPVSLVNHPSVTAFNQCYFTRYRRLQGKPVRQHRDPFLFPLDSISNWNRIYGPRGFQQFQCVIPEDDEQDAIQALLNEISSSGMGSFLAILKQFGDRPSPGLMSFPLPGTTLALDFPQRPGLRELLDRLDAIVASAGGRIYPAKDAHMSAAHFRQFYPSWERLEQYRDPALCSRFWKRVVLD